MSETTVVSQDNLALATSMIKDANEVLTAEGSNLGTPAIAVIVPAHVVYDFKKLWDWKFRGIPEKSRPMTLEGFIASTISEDGRAHAKYAEDSAYRQVEKLVFDLAKSQNMTPAAAAEKIGVQLREK